MVFLGHSASGGYSTGAMLAAAYVVGEIVGASLLGTLIPQSRMRRHLVIGFGVAAVPFAGLAMFPAAPIGVLAASALVAGPSPAASPGILRTLLARLVAEEDVPRAFSADAVIQELMWLAAPGLVVLLALQVSEVAPLALSAMSLAVASGSVGLLRSVRLPNQRAAESPRPPLRVLLAAWPIYLISAAAMSLMAVTELVLLALLQYRGSPVSLSGPLLMAFSACSAGAAFLFGLRTWPGSARIQCLVSLTATAVGIAMMAVLPNLYGIVAGCSSRGVSKQS
jgi:hypothetical protein